jgi:phosphatidylinositol glycan class M
MDIDYWIFTDAAKYVSEGRSPYDRHTYRYSPLVAYMFLPNIWWFWEFSRYLLLFFWTSLLIDRMYTYLTMDPLSNRTRALVAICCTPITLIMGHIAFRGSVDVVVNVLIFQMLIYLKRGNYDWAAIFYGIFF